MGVGTLIFSYIRRLGPYWGGGGHNFDFPNYYFFFGGGAFRKMIILGGMKILWIFLGAIIKWYYI